MTKIRALILDWWDVRTPEEISAFAGCKLGHVLIQMRVLQQMGYKRKQSRNFRREGEEWKMKDKGRSYWVKKVNGMAVSLSRIIWQEHYGPLPDHRNVTYIDGNPANCVLSNLRLATEKSIQQHTRAKALRVRLNPKETV